MKLLAWIDLIASAVLWLAFAVSFFGEAWTDHEFKAWGEDVSTQLWFVSFGLACIWLPKSIDRIQGLSQ